MPSRAFLKKPSVLLLYSETGLRTCQSTKPKIHFPHFRPYLSNIRKQTATTIFKDKENDDSVAFPPQIKLEVFYINPITLLAIMPQCTKEPGKEFHVL